MAAPNPFEQQQSIPGVRRILAVASGKGGVGKSTVAVNLALALAKTGARVGLLDADIYGPSVPRMLGISQKPEMNNTKILPIDKFGIKLMSIGFLIEEKMAVIWRGPMLFKAMDQFLRDVEWGELDYLVVDMPPGTGDVQLSLAQKVPVSGALIVCTPQNIALADVQRSIDMFARVGVPIIGMVENMAYLIAPQSGERIQLFPKGDLENYMQELKIPKLAEVPFHPDVSIGSENGVPIVEGHPEHTESKIFLDLAKNLRSRMAV